MNKRQSQIVTLVNQKDRISVTELAHELDVSEVTIRKDLTTLANYGILIRNHGYALKKNSVDIKNRLSINYEEKSRIAKRAAELIGYNETIFLGSGSTCALLAEEIAKTKMVDTNAASLEACMSMIKGTARSMGVTVED